MLLIKAANLFNVNKLCIPINFSLSLASQFIKSSRGGPCKIIAKMQILWKFQGAATAKLLQKYIFYENFKGRPLQNYCKNANFMEISRGGPCKIIAKIHIL